MAIAIASVLLSFDFILFAYKYLTVNTVLISTTGFAIGLALLAIAYVARKRMAAYSPKELMTRHQISFVWVGATAGLVIGFFALPLIFIVLSRLLGIPLLLNFELTAISGIVIGGILGGILGRWLFKRSKYSKQTYYDPFA